MRHLARIFALPLLLCFAASRSAAQGNYEIQVYGAPTVPKKSAIFELHSNFTFKGDTGVTGGTAATHHALHETIEITLGLTDWSEMGFYLFTSIQPRLGTQFVGTHIRPRVRVPDSWKWPVGVSLSTEIGYQREEFSEDTWTWEIRPIIDKASGRWYGAFNPALQRSWKGPGTAAGVAFNPNVKVGFDFTPVVSAGVEYYGSTGQIGKSDELRDQVHQFFAAGDLHVHPDWEIDFGVGIGTTPATDKWMAKLLVGRRISWGN